MAEADKKPPILEDEGANPPGAKTLINQFAIVSFIELTN
jgi:hypothetical protein